MTTNNFSHDYISARMEYNADAGTLIWKTRPVSDFASLKSCKTWNSRYAGKRAGSAKQDGYRQVCINGKNYREHRVIWFFVNGKWPERDIDHENGFRNINLMSNMRDVSASENGKNSARSISNRSGQTGVYWNRVAGNGLLKSKSSITKNILAYLRIWARPSPQD